MEELWGRSEGGKKAGVTSVAFRVCLEFCPGALDFLLKGVEHKQRREPLAPLCAAQSRPWGGERQARSVLPVRKPPAS